MSDAEEPDQDREPLLRRLDHLAESYERLGDTAAVLPVLRRAAAIPDRNRAFRLDRLARTLTRRHDETGDAALLRELAGVYRELIAELGDPPGSPRRAFHTAMLAITLRDLHKAKPEPGALDEAVELFRAAAGAAPDAATRSMFIGETGRALLVRHAERGDRADLDAAVTALQEAVDLAGTPAARSRELFSLGNAYRELADETGSLADLRRAVQTYRAALPDADAETARRCTANLASALERLGRRADDPALRREAVGLSARAAAAGPDLQARVMHWERLLAAMEDADAGPAAAQELVRYARDLVADADDGQRPARLSDLALSLMHLYDATGAREALTEAVRAGREAAATTAPGSPRRHRILANLGQLLRREAAADGTAATLDEAVAVAGQALAEAGDGEPDRPGLHGELATALLQRFERARDLADLHAGIEHAGVAVTGAATAGERAGWLAVLAMALGQLAFTTSDAGALDTAIARCREALALPLSPGHRTGTQVVLVEALVQRLKHAGADADAMLDQAREALHAAQEALAGWPAGAPGRDNLRQHVIAVLGLLAADSWAEPDMRAVAVAAEELADTDDWAPARYLAGAAYATLFDLTGRRADIDAAIRHRLRSLEALPRGDPQRPELLRSLGIAYRQRSKVSASSNDLDAAVRFGGMAVEEAGPDGPERASALAHLAAHLHERFQRTGRLADLDEAERTGREAVAIAASPAERAVAFTHLGAVLMLRYQAVGRAAALDEAIAFGRAAAELEYHDRPDPSTLGTLAVSLLMRYQLLGTGADLDEAVGLMRTAVAATEDRDPQAAIRLSNAANALMLRYQRTDDPADYEAAVGYAGAAIELVPPGGPGYPHHLAVLLAARLAGPDDPDNDAELDRLTDRALSAGILQESAEPGWAAATHNLGVALARRSRRTGAAADLDRAVDVLRLRLERARPDDPQLVDTRTMLGAALDERCGGTGPDHEEAIRLWRAASEQADARPDHRLDAAIRWIGALDGDPAAQLPAFRQALTLQSLLAWHGAPRADQEQALARWPGIAGPAAAAALDAGAPDTAVELLEQGRAVLWSQVLDGRTDLGEVTRIAPELAERMLAVRAELDSATDLLGAARAPVADPGDPGDPDPFAIAELVSAGQLRMSGDVAAAEEIFVRYAGAEHPALAVAGSFGLGMIRYERGDLDGAVAELARSLATGQGGMAMAAGNVLAQVHVRRGEPGPARQALRDVLRIDADAEEAERARDMLEALDELERDPTGLRVLIRPTLAGDDPDAMLALAVHLLERGDDADALRLFDRARQIARPEAVPGIDLMRGALLAAAGEVTAAVEALRSAAAAVEPDTAGMAALHLGDLLLEERDADEARAVYRRLADGPGGEHARLARRRLADLEPAAPVAPAQARTGPPAFDFGRWLAFHEPYEEAVSALRAAVEAGDRSGRTQLYLMLVCQDRDRDAAVTAARLGVVLGEPGEPAVVALCRSALRSRRGDRAGAAAALASAYDLATRAGDVELAALAAVYLGRRLEAEGDRAGAEAALRRAVRSGHRHHAAAAAFDLARMLAEAGDRDGARNAYRQAFELEHPYQSPMAGINLAVMLRDDSDDDAAAEVYRAVLDGPRPDAAARAALGLGRLLSDRGDVDGAKAAYRRSIEFGVPAESAPAAYNLGALLAIEGDRDGAKAAFRQAREGASPEVAAAAADALRRLRRGR